MIFKIRNVLYSIFAFFAFKPLYQLCRIYVHAYDGENCGDFIYNGEKRYIDKNAKKFQVVFDVGGNIGDYSLAVNKANSMANIFLFEPDPSNIEILRKRNFSKNIHINEMGLSEKEGYLTLYRNGVFSSLHPSQHNTDKNSLLAEVKLNTIDNFCEINNIYEIDFLKIDVEGHELSVLRGALKMLNQGKIKRIQVEYGTPSNASRIYFKDIYEFLLKTNDNFQFFKIKPFSIEPITYSEQLEKIELCNFLAVL